MRLEYDFDYSKTERSKYRKRLMKEGSNVVVLDRDVAKFAEAVYVLHAFQKKSRGTARHDVEVARERYRILMRERERL